MSRRSSAGTGWIGDGVAQHLATLDGVPVVLALAGWSLQATANGRDTWQGFIVSLDATIRPALDQIVVVYEVVYMRGVTPGNPAVVTTDEPHGIVSGQTIEIEGTTGGTPGINGPWTATVRSPTTFAIPVAVTTVGTLGYVQRRIFAGPILQPTEAGVGGWGRPPIQTTINAGDFSAYADRRYVNEVLLEGSLAAQLARLVSYLPCALHPAQVAGPTLPALPCEDVLVRDVLDTLATSAGGWVWEIDPWGYLRMYQPPADRCPVDVTVGNRVALGDVTVEPTRTGYTNRVILRFTAGAGTAYGFFQLTANAADGETVTLGSTTYTFRTAPGTGATEVGIGPDAEASMLHLISAIVGTTDDAGVVTGANGSASAFLFNGGVAPILKAIANAPGAAGNSVAVVTTCVAGEWYGEGHIGLETLELGSDAALTNRVVAEDLAQQSAHGIWETVIQSPETTDLGLATTLAEAYLVAHTPIPRTVRYETRALGIRPGQVQTITIPARNLNGTFLVTEVTAAPDASGLVRRSVTAIESLIVQSGDAWRALYSQWSGGLSTGGIPITMAAGGGGGGGGPAVAGVATFPLGGSDQARVPMGTPPAAAPVLNYNPYVAGVTASARLHVWVWAQTAGVLVGALWSRVTAGAPVDEASTGWIAATSRPTGERTIDVAIVAGQTYVLRVLSNTDGAGVYAIGQLEPAP